MLLTILKIKKTENYITQSKSLYHKGFFIYAFNNIENKKDWYIPLHFCSKTQLKQSDLVYHPEQQ